MKHSFLVTTRIETEEKETTEGYKKAREIVEKLGLKITEIKKEQKTRTSQQNKALHLWFTLLAEALNEAGQDMRAVIREKIDIPWTSYTVKEYLWRPCMKAYLDKKSTTEMTTNDIDPIYDIVNKVIGERTGVHVAFPCIEAMYQESISKSGLPIN